MASKHNDKVLNYLHYKEKSRLSPSIQPEKSKKKNGK